MEKQTQKTQVEVLENYLLEQSIDYNLNKFTMEKKEIISYSFRTRKYFITIIFGNTAGIRLEILDRKMVKRSYKVLFDKTFNNVNEVIEVLKLYLLEDKK